MLHFTVPALAVLMNPCHAPRPEEGRPFACSSCACDLELHDVPIGAHPHSQTNKHPLVHAHPHAAKDSHDVSASDCIVLNELSVAVPAACTPSSESMSVPSAALPASAAVTSECATPGRVLVSLFV